MHISPTSCLPPTPFKPSLYPRLLFLYAQWNMAFFNQFSQVSGVDEGAGQRTHFFSGMHDGPAKTAARITGLTQEPHAKDDSPIYTGNFGQPIPDPA